MKPKISTAYSISHCTEELERHTIPTIPSEGREAKVMFEDDLLAGLGMPPMPSDVYVLAKEKGTHAVTLRPQDNLRGLVCYPTAGEALVACNTRPGYSPAKLAFDAAIELALSKEPELNCLVLFRSEHKPAIHYIR